ncbi:uroporphyrinogen-III C-methyltransferase [Microlunatus sp. Y2014]|uniref:uroporphyrinogen-III C-methyltransferase n=1 Tax=Microlunatus sp. Y2014 TaxID=3418488 RepID=UPI003DA6D1F5
MSLLLSLDLRDRDVLVVGGGAVSARRTRDLVAAGARIRLISPELCPDLAELVGTHPITWHPRGWRPSDIDGMWLVHTATGVPEVDAAVAAACEANRTWFVDATDRTRSAAAVPARVTTTTPDGTVTVGVHTGGDPRRARHIATALSDQLEQGAVDLRRHRPREGAGWVALVGGGPGDDGLLTARARVLLRSADVVVIDRLAPRNIVATLPADVEVIDVGKSPGRHPVPQSRINEILVAHASAGRGVVRLKGGDPYVLGRGGEERLACEAAGVPVEVVPGISSAIAVPAAAGIPVTHRGVATGFTVVTGHTDLPQVPGGGDHTLVVLMGVSTLPRTVQLLLERGVRPDTPVGVVENGCTPQQRVVVGELTELVDLCHRAEIGSPAVVVIGDVVRLAPAWGEARRTPELLSGSDPSAVVVGLVAS